MTDYAREELVRDLVVKKLIASGFRLTIQSGRVETRESFETDDSAVSYGPNFPDTEKPMLSVVASSIMRLGVNLDILHSVIRGFLPYPCRIIRGELTFKALDSKDRVQTYRLKIKRTSPSRSLVFFIPDDKDAYEPTIEDAILGEIF